MVIDNVHNEIMKCTHNPSILAELIWASLFNKISAILFISGCCAAKCKGVLSSNSRFTLTLAPWFNKNPAEYTSSKKKWFL